MNFLFDLVLILIIVLCTFIGKKRGFIKTFFGFFGSVIALVLSSIFSRPVGAWLADSFFSPSLSKFFLNSIGENVGSVEFVDFAKLPNSVQHILEKFGTDSEKISEFVSEQSDMAQQQLQNAVVEYVVNPIATAVGQAVAFVILFIVLTIGIRILVRALNLIAKLPFLNLSNRFLGAGIGFLWGLLIAVILACVLAACAPALQNSALFSDFDPDKTIFVKLFSKLNLFFS